MFDFWCILIGKVKKLFVILHVRCSFLWQITGRYSKVRIWFWAFKVCECFIIRHLAYVIWKSPGKSHIGRRRRQLLQLSSSLSGVIGVCLSSTNWKSLCWTRDLASTNHGPGVCCQASQGGGDRQSRTRNTSDSPLCWGHTRLTWRMMGKSV